MTVPRRLLTLALDSASPELLRQWAADGTLPNIARLLSTGMVANTLGPEGMEVGATWPSFYTAETPGGHGICWVDRVIPGTYRQQRLGPNDFDHLTSLWDVLSAAGRRVVVLDVPFAKPLPRLNGVQVTEWGVHDGVFGFHTTPAALRRTILRTYGVHPAPPTCDTHRLTAEGYRDLAAGMVRGALARGGMTCRILADEPWDFAIQVWSEIHCAGHLMWHYHDPRHPAFDPAIRAKDGDLLREVYVAVDSAVGEVLATVGAETTVVLCTLHGMSHSAGSSLLLPEMLRRVGALHLPSRTSPAGASAPRRRGLRGGLKALYHLVPEAVRVPFYELRQWVNQRWLGRGAPIGIDPDRTRAFMMGFGAGSTYSGIRLNLRGREPAGSLAPGAEADRFCAQLGRDLLEFLDPDTGRPLVRRVVRTAELYPGPCLDELPDLLVEWEHDPPRGNTVVGDGAGGVWRGVSARFGALEHANGSGRTGAHRLEGMFVANGPGIAPGTLDRVVSTLDFAPTFARFFGCDMGPVAGRPIPELLPDG